MIKKGLKLNNNQKGLTLIESLVVVGILLGIVAVALTLYGTVRDRLNVKNESENASIIYSQVVDLYSDEVTEGLDMTKAVDAGIVPKKMSIINKVVTDSWGGVVTLVGKGTTKFTLTFPRVPAGDVCVSFIKNQKKVGWDSYKAGTGSEELYSASKNASIAGDCKKTTGVDYVSISFTRSDT